jgi:IS30 family transposase
MPPPPTPVAGCATGWEPAKRTDLRTYDAVDLAAIQTKLTTRPRKVLGWKTPAEVFRLAT